MIGVHVTDAFVMQYADGIRVQATWVANPVGVDVRVFDGTGEWIGMVVLMDNLDEFITQAHCWDYVPTVKLCDAVLELVMVGIP
jgi:predicted regulator of amino acid metabolism with ACT domain